MNVVLYMDSFNNDFINFLETKENIVTHGVFTKIMYSNTLFTMNGLYFFFPIQIQEINCNSFNKLFIKFDPTTSLNNTIIQHLSNIESSLLQLYAPTKKKNLIFQKQLNSGYIKIHTNRIVRKHSQFVVKISGIWEDNDDNIGITYKIIQISNNVINL